MMITRLGMDVNLKCKHRRGTSTSNGSLYLRLTCLSFATEKGGTILHVAARHGHLDLMRWVLQLRQVEVDALDDRGKTVRAAHRRAQIPRRSHSTLRPAPSSYARQALYRACVGKHTACALLLAEAGADTSFSTTRGGDALREAQAMRKSYGFDLKGAQSSRDLNC